jgi:hypothetical protein
LAEHVRRTLSSARAAKGWSWDAVASALSARGWNITPGNLMTRHSRGAFRADELLLLMEVLGVAEISPPRDRRVPE